ITSIINAALPQSLSTVYDLVAGDYVELVAFQDTVGAVNLSAAGNYSPEFGIAIDKGQTGAAGASGSSTPDVLQVVTNGTGAITTFVWSQAPANGNVQILYCNAYNTADPTAVSSTNTTWTKVTNTGPDAGNAYHSLWVGKVSGGAGGTTVT